MCERVLGIPTPTLPGIAFLRTKIRFYSAGHRKNETTTTFPDAGPRLCRVKMKFLEKSRILGGLFDQIEPELFEVQQQ